MATKKIETSQYVAWEKVGQSVTGTLLRVETGPKGKFAKLKQESGPVIAVSAPTMLAQSLEDNFDVLGGREVTITYVRQDAPTAKNRDGIKHFDVTYEDDESE